jgi:hypothetical protein
MTISTIVLLEVFNLISVRPLNYLAWQGIVQADFAKSAYSSNHSRCGRGVSLPDRLDSKSSGVKRGSFISALHIIIQNFLSGEKACLSP